MHYVIILRILSWYAQRYYCNSNLETPSLTEHGSNVERPNYLINNHGRSIDLHIHGGEWLDAI